MFKHTRNRLFYFLLTIHIFSTLTFSQKFEQGYIPTQLGIKKDKTDGIFANYDFVWKQNENLYVVKKKILEKDSLHSLQSWLVDKHGNKLTPKIYTDIGDFSEGLAEVTLGTKDFCSSCFYTGKYSFVVHLNNSHGFINEKGVEVIPPKYQKIIGSFSSGYCLVSFSTSNLFYINRTGLQQFNQAFKYAEPFRGTIAEVTFSNGTKNFINLKGEPLIPRFYKYIQPYNEDYPGMIRAFKKLNNKVGFWTSNCQNLLDPEFESFNYAVLKNNILVSKNNKFGFIDFYNGNKNIPLEYDDIRKDKNANFVILSQNNKWYRVNPSKNKQLIINANDIESLGKGTYKFEINKKWGLVDSLGIIKSKIIYDKISDKITNGFIMTQSNNTFGIIDINGKTILEPIYEKVGFVVGDKVFGISGFYQYILNTETSRLTKNLKPEISKNLFFLGVIVLIVLIVVIALKL
jgi:hypothetical protein